MSAKKIRHHRAVLQMSNPYDNEFVRVYIKRTTVETFYTDVQRSELYERLNDSPNMLPTTGAKLWRWLQTLSRKQKPVWIDQYVEHQPQLLKDGENIWDAGYERDFNSICRRKLRDFVRPRTQTRGGFGLGADVGERE